MKLNFKFILFIALAAFTVSHCQIGRRNLYSSYNYWKIELPSILADTSKQFYVDTLITNEKTALAIAEPILVAKYGQKHIDRDKPLVAIRVDNYWIVDGTLPRGWVGGTATVILRATDGKVMKLTHYR
jgi:hypothetical protein